MLTFHRAPRVTPGNPIRHQHLAGIGLACNDRIRSGIGDPTWRIGFLLLSLFRQVRNSDGGFLFPPNAEFYTVYQMLRPGAIGWPVTEPGEPEGANLASMLPAYVWGAEALDLADEASRLTDPVYGGLTLEISGHLPATAEEMWALGKLQRGAWDPVTRSMASPAFTAARSYAAIMPGPTSQHGYGYGGFMPQPELGTDCDDPDTSDDFGPPINQVYFFTAQVDDPDTSRLHGTLSTDGDGRAVCTYAGTCQPGPSIDPPDKYDSHIARLGWTPWAYYVMLNDGTLDELPTNEWLAGPFAGAPKLRKTWGYLLERAFNKFVSDFRGPRGDAVPTETPGSPPAGDPKRPALGKAMDLQRFISRQYPLAPARGELIGDSVQVVYPTLKPGDVLEPAVDCCLAGYIARPKTPGRLNLVRSDGLVLDTVNLQSGVPVLRWPQRVARYGTTATFDGPADCRIEIAELMDYRPWVWDWLLVTRIGGAKWVA